jgi:DNA-binding winged helix-turn-helix (wHTH) protein
MVRFGAFDVDLKTGELRSEEGPSILPPQLLKVLAILLERAGDLVTRDELCQRLWGEEVFVDYEHSLNKAVTKLRRILGDTAERSRYIETLERRGYRFVAPIEVLGDGALAGLARLRLVLPGRTVPLSEGRHMVGRDPAAAIRLDSTEVSRRHAIVTVRAGVATITDLGSRNGTFVNGERLAGTRELRHGDEMLLGTSSVVFESGDHGFPSTPPQGQETKTVQAESPEGPQKVI